MRFLNTALETSLPHIGQCQGPVLTEGERQWQQKVNLIIALILLLTLLVNSTQ